MPYFGNIFWGGELMAVITGEDVNGRHCSGRHHREKVDGNGCWRRGSSPLKRRARGVAILHFLFFLFIVFVKYVTSRSTPQKKFCISIVYSCPDIDVTSMSFT